MRGVLCRLFDRVVVGGVVVVVVVARKEWGEGRQRSSRNGQLGTPVHVMF